MELHKAQELAKILMSKHDLTSKGWRFEFDNAKRRFGCCNHRCRKITLSKALVSINNEARVKNTILHEIAHALVGGGHGHDWVWRSKALEIGCDGKRCYTSENTVTPESKYVAVCNGCGRTHKRHRKPTRTSACGTCCKGVFQSKYILEFKLNPNA